MNIIQIGTNRADDHLTSIVKKIHPDQINNLITVEPFDLHNESIKRCYQDYSASLHIENIIITPENNSSGKEKIWFHPKDLTHNNATELASLNKEHASRIVAQYTYEDMQFLELSSMTLNELFDKYNMTDIDILYIDTEGYDDKLIYSINLDKYKIRTIFYEHLHIDKWKLFHFLVDKGYDIEHSIEGDSYADMATLKL